MERTDAETTLAQKVASGCLLTDVEVASLLGVSVVTLRNWRCRHEGPRWVRIGRRAVRYRPAAIQAFIDDADTTQDATA